MIGGRTTLYRMFDAEGRLLYVGISTRPGERWRQHADEKVWWPEVARIALEHYATREQALEVELIAIRYEAPAHNIVGSLREDSVDATGAASASAPKRLPVNLARAHREYKALARQGGVTGTALGFALGVSSVMGRTWKRRVEAAAKNPGSFRIARREAPGTGRGVAA